MTTRACERPAGLPSPRQVALLLFAAPDCLSSGVDLMMRCLQARDAGQWGVILGTLGRQGNPRMFDHLCQVLQDQHRPYMQVR